jgi:hypothetical protein
MERPDECAHPVHCHSMTRMGRLRRRNNDNDEPAIRPIRYKARRYSVVCKLCGAMLVRL